MDTLDFKNELNFDEFPPTSTDEWESVIEQDLKGKDYKEALKWMADEKIEVLPFYRRHHLEELDRVAVPVQRSAKWIVFQPLVVKDLKSANKDALNALQNGATGLYFMGEPDVIKSVSDLERLLNDIQIDIISLKFGRGLSSIELLNGLPELIKSRNLNPDELDISIVYDPFTQAVFSGTLNSKDVIKQKLTDKPFTLNIDLSSYENAGANIIQQSAFALAIGNELLGLWGKDAAINFNFAVANSYFPEIAKLRAFRLVWNQVLQSYSFDPSKFSLHAETTLWNKSQNDAHNNMLRATTEAMSAVLGGTDALTVFPFDHHFTESSEFSNRISRNVQLILQEEAYFDKVADPGAGSYYIEILTEEIAKESWKLFQKIEENGGFYECLKSGFIQDKIQASRGRKIEAYKEKKAILLGVNKYRPDGEETPGDNFEIPDFCLDSSNDKNSIEIKKIEPLNMEVELQKEEV